MQLRIAQLLKLEVPPQAPIGNVVVTPVLVQDLELQDTEVYDLEFIRVPNELEELWKMALQEDCTYSQLVQAIYKERRVFLASLRVKVSISECSISVSGALLFRGRR